MTHERLPAVSAELIRRYLDRLGISEPPAPTLDGLRQLHEAHLQRVPFENLSIHLGEPIVLQPELLLDKVVVRRRGGFCYELNTSFAMLLEALGFRVTLLAASVFRDDGSLGPPFDHMCLRVDLEEPWLADVGFGDSFRQPLWLGDGREQQDWGRLFEIRPAPDDSFDLLQHGQRQFRFDLTARALCEFQATCDFHQSSPQSHFTQNPVCSIATPTGRVTVRGSELIVTEGSERSERELTPDEQLELYRTQFGIELDGLPAPPR